MLAAVQQGVEGRPVHLPGVDGLRRRCVGNPLLQRAAGVLGVGERLDDDSAVIKQQHVSVSEQLYDEPETPAAVLEGELDHPVEAELLDCDEARVVEVLAQNHCELGRLRGHRPVALRGVDPASPDDD